MFEFKKSVIGFAFIFVFAPLSYANSIFQSPSATQNVCDSAVGHWEGTGVVSTKILNQKIICKYKGVAQIEPTDTQYTYRFDVGMTIISGICPKSEKEVLLGQCDPHTGNVVLKSSDADLSGSLSPDGKSATLHGTVNIPIQGRILSANVDEMDLHKKE